MRSPVKGHNNSASLKALEDKLAEALVALKPFCLKKSWIRVPKKGSEIGVGGFGVVHRAVLQKWPFAPKVQVAVKKFHTNGEWEELLRVALVLVQELDVWAKLNHPNILPLNGFHLSSNLEEAWLVSPYATNGNLFEYLERTRLALDTRLELAKETAKGLEYLHTRMPPICHGDIKSLNVLIDSSGHAMLCDFGLTKATDTSTAATPRNDGGTIRYWSPELFDDDSYPTLNTDIWAWGCLLLEIITGLAPYHDVQLEGRLIHVISNKTLPAPLDTGNITFYRSQPLPPAPNVSSTAPLDHLERELEKLIGSLGRFRVDLSSFEFPKSGLAIGSGGFGVVHRATMRPNRRSSGVLVAVKKLRGLGGRDKRLRMVTALIREIAVWADLSHPLIIPFLGFYLSPQLEEAWLVAPLMTNGNLSQYVRSSKLRMDQRLMLALDTAKGLQYLHNHDPPVCHGDIKALNVLINSERRAVLCDFGLAKTMESMPSGLTTSTFKQAGSLAYESPELVCGKSLRGLESDVWAWGCLLQEVFSGQPPYHWANNSGVIVKWITQDIPPAVLQDVELLLDSDDDRSEENALGVLQQLEDKLGGILIKDLAINRSHVDFTEASKIGSSSFGVLYKGQLSTEPSTSNNRVAVKLLSPSSNVSNVPDEVIQQIVSQLQEKHINILRITGYCRDPSLGGDLLLLFPYISAGSLDAYLTRKALDDTKKLVLRNILINNMGRPLLSDFGFDKFAVHFKGVPATTESLRYQSPEVVAEASLGTLRGDAWSWGSCQVISLIMPSLK
ncbi:hypothetical protein FRB99_002995 [Tulasnella sp. 403]|nr:hypothetical protein FRB99_002995 [Tulasnella sp. 403]